MKHAVWAAERFVREYGLHTSEVPVDLSSLYELFEPVYEDLTLAGVLEHALFPPSGMVTPCMPARVFIERILEGNDRRLVYAHAVGHWLAGHLASAHTTALGYASRDRDEREAWVAAAVLLIPVELMQWGATVEDVAAQANVPVWLAQVYHDAYERLTRAA